MRIIVGFDTLRASFDVLPKADDLLKVNIAGDGGDNCGETSGELLLRAYGVEAARHGGGSPLWFAWLSCWVGLPSLTGCLCSCVVI